MCTCNRSNRQLHSWPSHRIRIVTPTRSGEFKIINVSHLTLTQRLYDPSRWDSLVRAFRLAVYNLNSLPTEPLLNLALYAGLASLKLPSCYDASCKNVDCPVCDPDLGVLAQEVPSSHHVNSTIVCQISGKIMNEDNPPMAFPNGYVYSREVRLPSLIPLFRLTRVCRLWKRWPLITTVL